VHTRAVGNKYSALLRNSVSSVSRGEALQGRKELASEDPRAEIERSRSNRIISRLIPHHRAILVNGWMDVAGDGCCRADYSRSFAIKSQVDGE